MAVNVSIKTKWKPNQSLKKSKPSPKMTAAENIGAFPNAETERPHLHQHHKEPTSQHYLSTQGMSAAPAGLAQAGRLLLQVQPGGSRRVRVLPPITLTSIIGLKEEKKVTAAAI